MTPECPVRIALLDDHEFVLQGLTVQLERLPHCRVVGAFAQSRGLIDALDRLEVDLILLDYALSEGDADGLPLIRRLRRRHADKRILVVSGRDDVVTVNMILRAGAHGFFPKRQGARDIERAIQRVMRGHVYLPDKLADELGQTELASLTPREWEVLRCFLDGMSVSDIAAKFKRSLKTVSAQKSAAFRKLGIQSNAQLFKLQGTLMEQGGDEGRD
ncbi:response regulator transcription factor [Dyella terrae]|nr:response regulator transcription factor [Dyella terrae]